MRVIASFYVAVFVQALLASVTDSAKTNPKRTRQQEYYYPQSSPTAYPPYPTGYQPEYVPTQYPPQTLPQYQYQQRYPSQYQQRYPAQYQQGYPNLYRPQYGGGQFPPQYGRGQFPPRRPSPQRVPSQRLPQQVLPRPIQFQPPPPIPFGQSSRVIKGGDSSSGIDSGMLMLLFAAFGGLSKKTTTTTTMATTTQPTTTPTTMATTSTETSTTLPTTTPDPFADWETFDTCRYYVSDTVATWDSARDICQNLFDGADLVRAGFNKDASDRAELIAHLGIGSYSYWVGAVAESEGAGNAPSGDAWVDFTGSPAGVGFTFDDIVENDGVAICGRMPAGPSPETMTLDGCASDSYLYVCEYCGTTTTT